MFGSSSGTIGATAVGAVVLVAAAIGITVFNADDTPPAEQPTVAAIEEAPDTPDAPDTSSAVVTPSAVAPDAPATAVAGSEPPPEGSLEAAPTWLVPHLDLVRVDPEGRAVIAGRTSPDLNVALMLDGVEIAETRADGAGAFVALLSLSPSESPRVLSVEARLADGTMLAGAETVLIAPFTSLAPSEAVAAIVAAEPTATARPPATAEPPVEEVAAVTPTDPADPEGPASAAAQPPEITPAPAAPEEVAAAEDVAAADVPYAPETLATAEARADLEVPAAPDALAAGPGAPAAPSVAASTAPVTDVAPPSAVQPARATGPAIVIASAEGLRVVQGPAAEPAVQTSVRLDAISYDAEGAVMLAGRGPAAANIQITLNNQPIQLGEVGPEGDWSLQLPDVDPGTYTLAVTELAEDGSAASRVETPFLREDPERVAEAPAQAASGIDVITVQPGFTLWGMAENTFGNGILYVQIFEENRDQIRDPNWIFPGQIFRMPDLDPAIGEN
ncbi:hypothetical protein A8B78_09175 [Jannaschia sp. EhC01]|nr:hypothetical protein A8B78_09175 [Jannaschia sp. EhC01]